VVAAIKRLNAPILTTSGAPVTAQTPLGSVTGIFFRDPDGDIVQAAPQASVPAEAPATGNVVGAMMGLTVEDMDTALNGELVNWSPTLRNVFVKDPGGLNIELVGAAPAAQ
jgi:hypothetical protein